MTARASRCETGVLCMENDQRVASFDTACSKAKALCGSALKDSILRSLRSTTSPNRQLIEMSHTVTPTGRLSEQLAQAYEKSNVVNDLSHPSLTYEFDSSFRANRESELLPMILIARLI